MMNNLPVELDDSNEFNCSAFLGHGLQWPRNDLVSNFNLDEEILYQSGNEKLRARETAEQILDECYYADEYNTLLQYMSTMEGPEIPAPRTTMTDDVLQEFSLVVDEALDKRGFSELGYQCYDKYLTPTSRRQDVRNQVTLCNEVDLANQIDLANEIDLANRDLANQIDLANRADLANQIDLANRADLANQIDLANEIDLANRDLANQIDLVNRADLAKQIDLANRADLVNQIDLANRADLANQIDLANQADLANRVTVEVPETPVKATPGLEILVEEHLEGFGEIVEEKPHNETRKRRLCRHFVKGFCMRGASCDFLHDPSIFCCDEQKVFLGGLPLHLTPQMLKTKLEDLGLTVLNKPRILRGFTPQVCLGSVEEADRLIAQRYIFLDTQRVDVREYKDRDQLRQVLPSVVKRSVFLGGLKENTTAEMIIRDIENLDVKVVEHPIVKSGYAPRIVLGSVEGAKMLVSLQRVLVNGTIVDVRPYVNFRKRY